MHGVSLADEKGGASRVAAFPQRKGKFKYTIYGLDLSDPQMGGGGIKVAEAEKHFVPEELQPVEEKCNEIEERILSLKAKRDDLPPLVADWKEFLQPKRLALLDRIKERNVDLYLKVTELLLTMESFETGIRDYSKLIDAHGKVDYFKDAERILQKMTESGIVPDILTSLVLVHTYSKARKEGLQINDCSLCEGWPPKARGGTGEGNGVERHEIHERDIHGALESIHGAWPS
ncbi:unnamed protein product [Musa hybrid cultivar]